MDTKRSSTAAMALARDGRGGHVEAAMVQLVRVVTEEHWTASTAARKLLVFTDHDGDVLRLVRAKVARGSLRRTTPVADRALATLDLAIAAAAER